jgi:ATP sulfurylase
MLNRGPVEEHPTTLFGFDDFVSYESFTTLKVVVQNNNSAINSVLKIKVRSQTVACTTLNNMHVVHKRILYRTLTGTSGK